LILRLSTLAGELGAADAERDVRGFAIKFYAEEGHRYLVGNNTRRYDEGRLCKISAAVQDALINVLQVTSDDIFEITHELPRKRFVDSPSFLDSKYSDDFILLDVAFHSGRPKEARLALLNELNARIVAEVGISPDDLMVHLSEDPGENFSCATE
jgi:hypothetical protein